MSAEPKLVSTPVWDYAVLVALFIVGVWVVTAFLWGNIDANHQETARMCIQHKFKPVECERFGVVP